MDYKELYKKLSSLEDNILDFQTKLSVYSGLLNDMCYCTDFDFDKYVVLTDLFNNFIDEKLQSFINSYCQEVSNIKKQIGSIL